MSLKIDRVQLEIVINNDQARMSLRALDEEFAKVSRQLKGLKKGTVEYEQASARLKSIKVQMDNIKNSIGIANMTMRELSMRQKELNGILMNIRPGTAEYKKLKNEIELVGNRITELKSKAKATGGSLSGMAEGFNKYFAMVTAFGASIMGLIMGFRKLIEIANNFNAALANLSALTGLVGTELKWLGEQAKSVAVNGTDMGIKITASAQSIVDGYTLMGSKKPELLKNKEALDLVTQAALTMADAAGIEATAAVESLAITMNQFSAPASQALKYINVLAAGSKEGAAEIPSISASMVKFGAAAAAANVSVEESVGLIEALAEKGLEGERAGTQIKTALIKMQTGADETNPKIVGLQVALDNLRRKNMSTTEMVKFFGQEAYVASEILVSGAEKVKYYTQAVTGTKIAFEQATINTETNSAALQRAKNRMEITAITLGEKLAPALTFSTNSFNYFVKAILAAPEFYRKNEIGIIAFIGALFLWRAAQIKTMLVTVMNNFLLKEGILLKIKDAIVLRALIVQEQYRAAMIGKTTIAQKAAAIASIGLRNAMALIGGPIGLIIIGITALVAAIKYWDSNNAGAILRQNELATSLNSVNSAIKVLSINQSKYNQQIEYLNRISLAEKIVLRDMINLTLEQTKAKLLLLKAKSADIEISNKTITVWQGFKNMARGFGNLQNIMEMNWLQASANAHKAVTPYLTAIVELEKGITDLEATSSELNYTLESENIADNIGTGSIMEMEEKVKYLGIAMKNAVVGSVDYFRITNKLSIANKQLSAATEESNKSTLTAISLYEALSKELTFLEEKLRAQVMAGASNSVVDATLDAINKLKDKKDEIDNITKFYLAGKSFFDDTQFNKDSEKRADEAGDIAASENEADLDKMTPGMNQAMLESDYKLYLSKQTADGQRKILIQQLKDNLISQSEYADSLKQIDKIETENKLKVWAGALDSLSTLFGEQTVAYRILASARAGIDTYLAATAALAPPPEGAGPLLGPILAGTTILMGLANIAKINGIQIGQRAKGKYNVIGADDGRSYKADWGGSPSTKIYNNPTLVAEQGPELIIDADTTKNLQLNYPGIIDAIYSARVPQRASGNLADNVPSSMDPSFIIAVQRLNENLEKGIRSKLYLYDLEEAQNKLSNIKSNSTF